LSENMESIAFSPGRELTIAFAATEHQRLCEALSQGSGDLALDLSAVAEFDSAGVQLLLAARRSLQARGHELHITATSPLVHQALTTFGLTELLGAAAPRP
jgi:anti-sigma B factor antagonist